MLDVKLPYRFTKDTMGLLIDKVITKDLYPKDQEIRFNFCSLNYIEPSGVTILSNLFQWLMARGVNVKMIASKVVPSGSDNGLKYLDDSMFFNRYLGKTLYDNSKVRNTTLELQNVTYSGSYQWLESTFTPWLAREMCLKHNSLDVIRMCFGEIFNNINDHAEENSGCIFAQHYPRINRVKISISDFGIGIPNTIRKVDPSLTDTEALEKAVEEGYSSKSTPRNRGAGLSTLIKNVVGNYGGEVHIHSFRGILTCKQNNSDGVWIKSKQGTSNYPGTFIEIVLDTRNFEDEINDEEEFEWDL
ncbi:MULTISPECIES: ATP-binding protein [Bacillus subtilis group]|uniref:ATP-binding protein n=1 Tax=Bacillus subtilis group TaxID=653685 RepID=UPI000ACE6530|nr:MULTISPECIES: ATP-binding protein [Bacillus subtilis group]MCM3248663.1 ATP-binding protein [Bacillus amyloliquefaciens]MCY7426945.1 ATP-binding protein [Bacillus amyloliquefaciens]MDI6685466.1 ATP-binding protein [Bacillus subtilis]MEC0966060.1 ATP-binding protein [Bacillus amyloliquefaciens]MEC1013041.1 ATP-binding protein [Bacillus amyloliquefaciens]